MHYLLRIIRKIIKVGRRNCWTLIVKKQCGTFKGKVVANYRTKVTKNTFLGNNVNFNGLVVNGNGKLRIGDNFHSGSDCLLITQNHNFDNGKAIPYDDTYILKDITIGDNVWLGNRVIILGGVTIGEGAIIQAGSCVVDNIPAFAIAGGHPARVFSQRNIEHYKKLKINGNFH